MILSHESNQKYLGFLLMLVFRSASTLPLPNRAVRNVTKYAFLFCRNFLFYIKYSF